MDLAFIDMTANKGDSVLHQSSAISKFLFTACILTATILAHQIVLLLGLLTLLFLGYLLARIPLKEIGHYLLYPGIFSLTFAAFAVSFSASLVIILKALTAATALLLLLFTTPYPQIFGILRRFLPSLLVDGMFFTYRIFFLMIKEINNLLTIVRLRGGNHPFKIIQNLRNIAGALGVLFIHSFDLSEHMYQILLIRGYTGELPLEGTLKVHRRDLPLLALGLLAIFVVVIK